MPHYGETPPAGYPVPGGPDHDSAATGVLTGPILHSSCTPVSGSPDSLSAHSGTFECLAANKTNASDGTESGYRYSGTVDYDTGSITWHLGG